MSSIAEQVIARGGVGLPADAPAAGSAAMSRALVSLARLQAAQGRGDELGRCLGELLRLARRDAACLACELERDPQRADGWQLRGHWSSLPALEAHLQSPHLQLLGRLVGGGLVRYLELSLAPHPAALAP